MCFCGESLDVPTAALERDQWPKAAAYEKLSMTVMKLHHPPGDMGVKTRKAQTGKGTGFGHRITLIKRTEQALYKPLIAPGDRCSKRIGLKILKN